MNCTPSTSYLDFRCPTSKGREGYGGRVEKGREGNKNGREKGECGRREEAWGGEKGGRGREGINPPHGHLKTLAALQMGAPDKGTKGVGCGEGPLPLSRKNFDFGSQIGEFSRWKRFLREVTWFLVYKKLGKSAMSDNKTYGESATSQTNQWEHHGFVTDLLRTSWGRQHNGVC